MDSLGQQYVLVLPFTFHSGCVVAIFVPNANQTNSHGFGGMYFDMFRHTLFFLICGCSVGFEHSVSIFGTQLLQLQMDWSGSMKT